MSIGIKILILLLVMTNIAVALLWAKNRAKLSKLKIYEDITLSVLNKDIKTRKAIEKQCNEYLEHKVINSKIVNDNYLKQCNLILDTIKYINLISSIEETSPVEKQLSKIEQAIESNCTQDNEIKSKGGRKRKGDNGNA